MSRSKSKAKRIEILPDTEYGSVMLAKFINRTMLSGKKGAAKAQVYFALKDIKEKTKQDPLLVFNQAIENVKPQMEVRSRRVGGAAYQVPAPVKTERRESLATRWIVQAAQKRPSSQYRSFGEKLSAELIDAFNNTGGAIKKKEDTHKMAESNKAFSHFRW